MALDCEWQGGRVQETTCVSHWVLMLLAGQVRSHHREKAGEVRRWERDEAKG